MLLGSLTGSPSTSSSPKSTRAVLARGRSRALGPGRGVDASASRRHTRTTPSVRLLANGSASRGCGRGWRLRRLALGLSPHRRLLALGLPASSFHRLLALLLPGLALGDLALLFLAFLLLLGSLGSSLFLRPALLLGDTLCERTTSVPRTARKKNGKNNEPASNRTSSSSCSRRILSSSSKRWRSSSRALRTAIRRFDFSSSIFFCASSFFFANSSPRRAVIASFICVKSTTMRVMRRFVSTS